jgi:hypothetical protein
MREDSGEASAAGLTAEADASFMAPELSPPAPVGARQASS